jgi:galactokinase/mevalonate kinase-like predicted kinase
MKKNGLRIYHPWWLWECYKAGFYSTIPPDGKTKEQCKEEYAIFLSDIELFNYSMDEVIKTWKYSSEHFLSNPSINRIAWLGQSSMCLANKIPSAFKSGFFLLDDCQKTKANNAARIKLNDWENTRLY